MKSRSTGAKKRADVLFSKIVRARGRCQRCGSANNLQCAHIVSRRFSTTRCLELNAWCLCAGCHMRLTEWPNEHVQFAHDTIGADSYEFLRVLALTSDKVQWEDVAEKMAERWKVVEA